MNNDFFEEKSIQTQNGRIFYYLNQQFPNRPTIILLHGLSSNHTTWLNTIKILNENKYNSLAPDLRGHGLSDKTKNKNFYALPVFSNDLRDIAKNEQINSFILVGYSFGGQIAIDFTAKYPGFVKGLILISTNYTNPLEYKGLKFLTPIVSLKLNLLAYLFLWQKRKKYHFYQHGKAVGYWDSVWDGLRTMPVSINFWMLRQVFNLDLKNEIQRIKVPTTIVYGKNDAFITKDEINDMAKYIPKSKIIISKSPDHFVGTNSQNETAEIILNFLREHESHA